MRGFYEVSIGDYKVSLRNLWFSIRAPYTGYTGNL